MIPCPKLTFPISPSFPRPQWRPIFLALFRNTRDATASSAGYMVSWGRCAISSEKINTNDVPLTRVVPRRISCRYTPRDNTLHTRFQCFFALTDIGGLVSAHDPRRACRFLFFSFFVFSRKKKRSFNSTLERIKSGVGVVVGKVVSLPSSCLELNDLTSGKRRFYFVVYFAEREGEIRVHYEGKFQLNERFP